MVHNNGDPQQKKFRIALVFPPAMHPSSPPLGIASLKGHLGAEEGLVVRNFDLNLAYYETAFEWLRDGRLRMSIQGMDHDTTARKAGAARDFLRGHAEPGAFFEQARYDAHAGVYTGFESVLNGLFDNFSRKMLLGLPVPPLARRFFECIIEPVRAFKPDLIGFSILFSQQLFFGLGLAGLCRGTGAKIVFGGATFSVMPDPGGLLAGPVRVFAGKDQHELDAGALMDFMIVGEGEAGLGSLVENLASGEGVFAGVPGLIRRGDRGLESEPPQAIANLNDLAAPDFSDFPLDRYHSPVRVLPYLASRGCPWRRCAFCTHQKTYLDYREEWPERTAERLWKLAREYGTSHFCLVDEMIQPHRLDRISSCLLAAGVEIFFSAYAKPSGFTRPILQRAYRSGLRVLMWGLESASQRVLDLMRKGTKAVRAGEILEASSLAGIWNLLFVIFGFPTETEEEWRETVEFLDARSGEIDALSKSRYVLLHGSDMFCDPAQYGISKVMDRPRRDPVSIAYDYETETGLSQDEVTVEFEKLLPRLSGIGRSPYFGQFREHMLLFAAKEKGKAGRAEVRESVPEDAETGSEESALPDDE
ncbi:MAG: radical SAM protein [Desulfobacteraceae bacterium]|nr:radical SAM protein [Desulfobacteraceae bacterium]